MTQNLFEEWSRDPLSIFRMWLEEAQESEINDPEAMCLATCDALGHPSARMVLLKGFDESGFRFHTNENSQKSKEFQENPHAALCFHWKSLRKQVRVEGIVSEVETQDADVYFATRPRARQIGAWASDQSAPLESRAHLEEKIKAVAAQYEGRAVPRPPYWKGYRLQPARIEFWFDNPDRLHDRFVFTRLADGGWSAPQRLYP